jgi:peptidoglycan/xylan/chitin deacetylase (PgdA/CDA1 family)
VTRTLRRHSIRATAFSALVAALGLGAPADAAVQGHPDPGAKGSCLNGYVGLTYDDGPGVTTTPHLLQALRRSHLRATMFNQGNKAQARPDLVRRELAAGMWVGNHTFTHPHLPQLAQPAALQEIASTQHVLTNITGRAPTLFRPPYGETNDHVRTDASQLQLLEVLWTVDSRDWAGASPGQIVAAAATLRPGGILVMHDWSAASIAAVPGIAALLTNRGLCAGRIAYTPRDIICATCFGAIFHAIAVNPDVSLAE